ncbi:MAG: DUF3263 domain-containing protein [Nocardioides sp.]|nr:DUF3263 domain-containing protein [Nocardioides sp.]
MDSTTTALSVRDHMTLQLEGTRFKYAGVKESRVRELFGETATRYYQRLDALLESTAALAAYPTTVRRLQRLREQRRALRRPA